MRAAIKIIFFDDNDEKFFGEGPYRLLLAIEKNRFSPLSIPVHGACLQQSIPHDKKR